MLTMLVCGSNEAGAFVLFWGLESSLYLFSLFVKKRLPDRY